MHHSSKSSLFYPSKTTLEIEVAGVKRAEKVEMALKQ